jgi:hypothetical protein
MHRYRASRLWPAKRVKSQVWTSERNALQAHALSFAGIRGPSLTVYCMTFAGRRVLLVEDEFLAGLTTIGVLEGFGCEVVGPVARLAMALRLAKFETLDAAVLDINVAGELIWPVAEELHHRGVPFRILSAYLLSPSTEERLARWTLLCSRSSPPALNFMAIRPVRATSWAGSS